MNKTAIAEFRMQQHNMVEQYRAALPPHIPVERFCRVAETAIQTNPDLLGVERRSLFNALMRAAQDGLLPDGRLGAIVIYKDKRRGPIAQWLPMIAGIRQKVRNSGEVSTWEVHIVHEKDQFDFELGDSPRIVHRPVPGSRGNIIAAYSIAVMKDGGVSREVMWIDEIEDVRKASRYPDGGPWVTWYGEMCKKTVAKRHAKVLPMSSDLDDLLRRDDEDAEPPAPIERARPRTLGDALGMMAGLDPVPPAADDVPESADDEIETIDEKREAGGHAS
jgi:recombination protein RecT